MIFVKYRVVRAGKVLNYRLYSVGGVNKRTYGFISIMLRPGIIV